MHNSPFLLYKTRTQRPCKKSAAGAEQQGMSTLEREHAHTNEHAHARRSEIQSPANMKPPFRLEHSYCCPAFSLKFKSCFTTPTMARKHGRSCIRNIVKELFVWRMHHVPHVSAPMCSKWLESVLEGWASVGSTRSNSYFGKRMLNGKRQE